jgi:DNA-binding MarR family transcriptional regulator
MSSERRKPAATPCLCNALRQATWAVSRLYDEDLRGVGLRTTQFSLLRQLRSAGEAWQRDLSGLTSLDETTLTRNLRPLIEAGWVEIRPREDRREKLVSLTEAGAAKLREARPRWERTQERMRSLLPEGT